MKKVIYAILFLCLICFIIYNFNNKTPTFDDSIRIRVVASNNNQSSIKLKEQVKDTILNYLKYNSVDYYKINELVAEITTDYKMEERYEDFPAKVIKNKIIPSGSYKTLVITLGDGKGSNWWSLLYPEYFNLTYDDFKEIEYKSYFAEKFS
ncbi:MAG: stage II sporulation protein R [Bacilli bacterium]|nr:stage II sporulation protein R [Bacilli bacterium]